MTFWFEDMPVDRPLPLGTHYFDQAQATAFAKRFEPYLLTAPSGDAAIVSGWLIAFVGHRLMLEHMQNIADEIRARGHEPGESGPGPGCELIGFEDTVVPGQAVTYTRTIVSKRRSASFAGWGLVANFVEGRRQNDGALVYAGHSVGFIKCRSVEVLQLRTEERADVR